MPAALDIDWAAVEQAAIQGVGWTELAKRYASNPDDPEEVKRLSTSFRVRSHREGWAVPRTVKAEAAAKAIKQGRVTVVTKDSRHAGIQASTDQIGRFREEIPVLLAEKVREKLVTVTEEGLPDIRNWRDMQAAVNVGYKVAGLDTKEAKATASVHFISLKGDSQAVTPSERAVTGRVIESAPVSEFDFDALSSADE